MDSNKKVSFPLLDLFENNKLPVFIQSEMSECGLTCLAMISHFYGYNIGLSELRRKYSSSLKGTSFSNLSDLADNLGLSCRGVKCDLSELRRLKLPCIIHWGMDHFVVLRKVQKKQVVIHDPARGKRWVSYDEFSDHYTGVAMELTPASNFVKHKEKGMLKIMDLWSKVEGFYPVIFQILIITIILQGISVLSPLINQLIVDEAIAKGDSNFLNAVIIGFFVLLVIRVFLSTLRSYINMYFGTLLNYQMGTNVLRHLMRLESAFFEKRHIGDIISRLGSVKPVQNFVTSAILTVFLDGILAVVTIIVMFLYSTQLSLMVIGVIVLSFLLRLSTFQYQIRLTEEKIVKDADLQTVLLETIRDNRSIKIFGKEIERLGIWQNSFAESINSGLKIQKFSIIAGALGGLFFGLLELAIYYTGALLVINLQMTLGMFFAFLGYRGQFEGRINALIGLFFSYKTIGLHLDRVSDIIYSEQEKGLDHEFISTKPLEGQIEFKDVSFRYSEADPWVLKGVSFTINSKDIVAFVGPSGGGKSTLMKLMIGLHHPTEGEILYDGQQIMSIGLRATRKNFGVVMQDDNLLSGNLYENISFF